MANRRSGAEGPHPHSGIRAEQLGAERGRPESFTRRLAKPAGDRLEAAMEIKILAGAESVAREGASIIAAEARGAVAARGRFILAVSGGHTPWLMLRDLAGH